MIEYLDLCNLGGKAQHAFGRAWPALGCRLLRVKVVTIHETKVPDPAIEVSGSNYVFNYNVVHS